MKDLAVLYLAMTGGDFADGSACREAGDDLIRAGLTDAAKAISDCFEATLAPDSGVTKSGGKRAGKARPPKP
ncbi:MAG: hypothetical protein COB37_11480 [Kordiimonadales bacterium]|nr:MAG: hypothetical protein COB37_11480 [Kordiimonadales bacterium]